MQDQQSPRQSQELIQYKQGNQSDLLLVQDFVVGKYQRSDRNISNNPRIYEQDDEEDEEEEDDAEFQFSLQATPLMSCNFSRFAQDFEGISKIGSGGFGQVFKGRNKLDGNYYAIKKVLLNFSDEKLNQKTKNEAIFLSRIQHANIVRYYQAWTENVPDHQKKQIKKKKDSSSDENDDCKDNSKFQDDEQYDFEVNFMSNNEDKSRKQSSQYGLIDEEESDDEEEEQEEEDEEEDESAYNEEDEENDDDDDNQLAQTLSQNSNTQRTYRYDGVEKLDFQDQKNQFDDDDIQVDWINEEKSQEKQKVKSKSKAKIKKEKPKDKKNQYLFIQMEFCSGETLRSRIDQHALTTDQKKNILRQILEALTYLHLKRYIHRDLKPQNIFLDNSLNVKLGDFGLATEMKAEIQHEKDQTLQLKKVLSSSEFESEYAKSIQLTQGIGTYLYLAPEQDETTSYDSKVDMYSLGIIMFEMYYPFKTDMERYKYLLNLKQGIFPEDFDRRVGIDNMDIKDKIKSLIQKEPKRRPEAKEFLNEYKDKQFQEMIRSIANPKHSEYRTMIQMLFECKQHSSKQDCDIQYASTYYDIMKLIKMEKQQERIYLKEFIKYEKNFEKRVEMLFYLRGAIKYDISQLVISTNNNILKCIDGRLITYFHTVPNLIYYMQEDGTLLNFSDNLVQPFIQHLNQTSLIKNFKRFSFQETHKKCSTQSFKYDSRKLVCYDIVFEDQELQIPYMIELASVGADIIREFVDCQLFKLRVSSTNLLEAIVQDLGYGHELMIKLYKSNDLRQKLKKYQSNSSEKDKMEIIEHLVNKFDIPLPKSEKLLLLLSLRSKSVEVLEQYLHEKCPKYEYKLGLMRYFFNSCTKIFEELRFVDQFLRSQKIIQESQIEFEIFLINENRIYYSGIHFEFVEITQMQKQGQSIADFRSLKSLDEIHQKSLAQQERQIQEISIMTAGIYSHLVQQQRFACGLQLNMDSLNFRRFYRHLMLKRKDPSLHFQPLVDFHQNDKCMSPYQLDVIILSEGGEDLINEKIRLAIKLWQNQISAIYIPKAHAGNKFVNYIYDYKVHVILRLKGKEVIQTQFDIFIKKKVKARIRAIKTKMQRGELEVSYDQIFEIVKKKLEL